MLPDAEHIQPGLIGQLRGGNHFLQALGGADTLSGMAIGDDIAQCINAEFKLRQACFFGFRIRLYIRLRIRFYIRLSI